MFKKLILLSLALFAIYPQVVFGQQAGRVDFERLKAETMPSQKITAPTNNSQSFPTQEITDTSTKQSSELSKDSMLNTVLERVSIQLVFGVVLLLLICLMWFASWIYQTLSGRKPEKAKDMRGGMIASRTMRLINFSIDFFILINVIYSALIYGAISMEWSIVLAYPFLFWLLIVVTYYISFEALFSRTPGKFLTGTKVITNTGEIPGITTIALRTIIRFVPFDTVSFLFPPGWHDAWSKTMVVSCDYKPQGIREDIKENCKECGNGINNPDGSCIPCSQKSIISKISHQLWHQRLRNALLVLVPLAWFIFAFFEGELDEFPQLLLFMIASDLAIFIAYEAIIYVVYGTSRK